MNRRDFIKSAAASAACASAGIAVPSSLSAANEAEKGNLPKEVKTPNVVKKHYELGAQFGVNGTPSIVTSTGELIGGYLKPADLLSALEETTK